MPPGAKVENVARASNIAEECCNIGENQLKSHLKNLTQRATMPAITATCIKRAIAPCPVRDSQGLSIRFISGFSTLLKRSVLIVLLFMGGLGKYEIIVGDGKISMQVPFFMSYIFLILSVEKIAVNFN